MSDTAFLERDSSGGCGSGPQAGEGDDGCGSAAGWRRVPSVRIPVTPENRAMLREMRARELAGWEGDVEVGGGVEGMWPREARETQGLLVLFGAAAVAFALQATPLVGRVMEVWEWVRGLVLAGLG